jgi:predicted nucleic-acid-binding Zn-ribbon protein
MLFKENVHRKDLLTTTKQSKHIQITNNKFILKLQ